MTNKHGDGPRFELACPRADPSPDGIFHRPFAADVQTPTEGILDATSLTIDLASVIRMSAVPHARESYRP